jgi:tetratricopeptide (TPR) repeat protein
VKDNLQREHREVLRLMQARDWRAALQSIDNALRLAPPHPALLMNRAQCLMALGLRADAFAAAEAALLQAPKDPALWDAAGTLYSLANDQKRALAAYDAAAAVAPENPQVLYNRASVRRYLGDFAGAEEDYDRVIALQPTDYEAYKNRADLRIQTAQRNHVGELERLLSGGIADWRGDVQVRYALAKEYEDLGDYAKSFDALSRAAKRQREHLKYNLDNDIATVQWIMDSFPAALPTAHGAGEAAGEAAGACEDAPIFVVGLPRSGTTLIERILSSHSNVFSAGELDCFALAVVAAVRRKTGRAQMPRRELIAHSASLDAAALGRDYIRRASSISMGSGRFIDKMPLNYLYIGLIRRALPSAKIVHLTRHPMALCYAMYKTLFKDGYPFSYDLQEIGRFYIGYRRLMAHWQETLPGAIYQASYENLVTDQMGETRKLLEFCGLDWEDACGAFHENPAASTTASAAQVRRPIYESSLSQWRHYEAQLAGLRRQLEQAGMEI